MTVGNSDFGRAIGLFLRVIVQSAHGPVRQRLVRPSFTYYRFLMLLPNPDSFMALPHVRWQGEHEPAAMPAYPDITATQFISLFLNLTFVTFTHISCQPCNHSRHHGFGIHGSCAVTATPATLIFIRTPAR